MQPEVFDAIAIGTGQANPALAVKLAQAGKKVAVIERHKFGGTCVNTGCRPTKTLVASARVAHVARRAADFGVNVGPIHVDMQVVKARATAIIEESSKGVEAWLRNTTGIEVVTGHARFVGPRRVQVGERVLEAAQVFVDVGGRALVPAEVRAANVPYLTNTTMLELDQLPAHLVVLGGGYIALEFAQMYRRFGSEVTVIERGPRLAAREDDDVSSALRELFEAEGIRVLTGATLRRVTGSAGAVEVHLDGQIVSGSHLLVAIGRETNTHDLGVETAGIELDARGFIQVDDELRTTAENVWALGDCNGKGAFTHTAWNDHEIVADNVLSGGHRRVSDRILAYAMFVDPPLARCGITEREAKERSEKTLVARLPMARVGRARERSETHGFMKVLVDAESECILGASLFGIEADEVIHVLLDAMYTKTSYEQLQRMVHIHPTVSEFVATLLEGLEPL